MLDISLKELITIAKVRSIKGDKIISKGKLLGMLDKTEQVKKTKTIRDIRKEKFGSDKIFKDIRTFYESEEDYYEPARISNAFNNNYIEYESNGGKDKVLSVKEYLAMIKEYLRDIINDHKTQDEWKIQLTMEINFIFSKDSKDCKDSNETRSMHATNDKIEIMNR